MKLWVICGHGSGDSGAVGNGYAEAERVRALGAAIKELGGDSVELLDTSRNWYADKGVSTLSIPKGDALVELHMDSGPSSARGGHVIIKAGIGGPDAWDRALAERISAMFPGRSSIISERSDIANPNRAYAKGINYRLAENGFISNQGDVETFNSRLFDLARSYLEAFGLATAHEEEPEDQEPEKPPLPEALSGYVDLDSEAWYISAVEEAVEKGYMGGYDPCHFGPSNPLTRAEAVCAIANASGDDLDTYLEPFHDVTATPFYYSAVCWAVEHGVIAQQDTFRPDDAATRAEFVCMLHNWRGNPEPVGQPTGYRDWAEVPEWARGAVAWAVEQGVVSGSSGLLLPNVACSRAEAAAMLANLL